MFPIHGAIPVVCEKPRPGKLHTSARDDSDKELTGNG